LRWAVREKDGIWGDDERTLAPEAREALPEEGLEGRPLRDEGVWDELGEAFRGVVASDAGGRGVASLYDPRAWARGVGLLGYALWAPLTLVIKGAEGFVVGTLAPKGRLTALLGGAIVMITGYTLSAGVLYGWAAAPVELGTDVLQTGAGAAFALILVPVLARRVPFLQKGSL
jgi:hypothetical protein